MNNYKFYITHNSITTEVYPLYDKLKFSWKKDGVRFRKECKTDFKFINNPKLSITDYTTLLAIENEVLRCNIIDFEITRTCDRGTTYSSYWTGSFSINDGKFNLDQCTYNVTPSILDKYSCILKNFNKEYNLLLSGPLMTIKNYERTDLQFMYCELNYADPQPDPTSLGIIFYLPPVCFPDFPTPPGSADAAWSWLYSDIVDLGGGDWHGTIIIYKRVAVTVFNVAGLPDLPPPTGFGQYWEIPGTNNGFTTQFAFEYFAPPNFVATYGADITSVNCGDTPANPFDLTGTKIIDCVNGKDWYYIQAGTGHIDYTQFRTLYDAMLYIVQQTCPTITGLISDFFEWNPIGDAPGYVAGVNYVTGSNNVVSKTAIAQKSDIINPAATQPATIGNISLKELMDNCEAIFHVFWFIDSLGNFRVEHEKYFTFTTGFNTSVGVHAKYNVKNNIYSYKKESMPSVEKFKFMEAFYLDFIGKDITYTSECTVNEGENNTKEYIADKFTTDIDYIEAYPTDIEKTGFVLVVYNSSGGVNAVAKELCKLSNAMQNNGHLSWANLQYNYHRYGRVLLTGNMNGTNETFFTAIRNKVQSNVKLQICCADSFDPTGILVQTELGTGEIETAEEQDNIVKLQINL